MSDNLLFTTIPLLAIAFAIEGYFKTPINNFLAHIALKKRRIDEIEMQYVIELASNINFLILESIRVFAQGVTFFLTLIIFFMIGVQQQGLLMDLVALLFGVMSIWIGHKATANLSIINQAREFYREDKQIEEELGPDFDETAYISQSPKNVERLRRAIKQYETGQHIPKCLYKSQKRLRQTRAIET
jgi:hypothetical protein